MHWNNNIPFLELCLASFQLRNIADRCMWCCFHGQQMIHPRNADLPWEVSTIQVAFSLRWWATEPAIFPKEKQSPAAIEPAAVEVERIHDTEIPSALFATEPAIPSTAVAGIDNDRERGYMFGQSCVSWHP
jgi:hypothetical protein